MQENEFGTVLNILQTNYPATYRGLSVEEATRLKKLWYSMFGKYEKAVVLQALKNYLKVEKYPPTIAGLQEQLDLLTTNNDTSLLWTQLRKALSYYHYKEKFEKLPKELKTWVGYPSKLKELSLIETNILNTVVYGQFVKQIGTIQEREYARKDLPNKVQKVIDEMKLIEEL